MDVNKTMKHLYEKGISLAEEKDARNVLAKTHMNIKRNGKVVFVFPGLSGESSYKAVKRNDGCFDFSQKEVSLKLILCVNGNSMTMENTENGYIDHFIKI